jgi:putative Mg2+ transporter-C (MgtC) family protein
MEHLIAYLWPIVGSLVAGAAIGFEREYRGRSAGFRTHILVGLASTLLMLAAARQAEWHFVELPGANVVADPTRLAHGVLTGVGFLCGGVIFREGFSVHGLTTAASLWITAALGLLFGVELYTLAITGTVATVAILTSFRLIEARIASQVSVDAVLRYGRGEALHEDELRSLFGAYGFKVKRIGWSVNRQESEHRLKIAGFTPLQTEALAGRLRDTKAIASFELSPRDD